MRRAPDQPANPWSAGTLEWWADSPPAHGNFRDLPPIHSARPVIDAGVAAGEGPPT
jgi:heme/copper-type cytochrome/quinol oxidase subunit 1